jgi:uncharacterized repeat protein (TIGR04076 family)
MEKEIEKQGIKNIMEKYKCKITVLKKSFNEELYRKYPYDSADACGRVEEGQVFITENRWDPLEGFCHWAWSELQPMIHSIHSGSELPKISCCTDGLRPVTFLLERVE